MDEETKRRVELAAAKYNIPVTEYCLSAVRQQLAEDEVLEAENVTVPVKPAHDEEFIAGLRALQAKIKTRRNGQPVDIDRVVEQLCILDSG